jgi:hypothetical protein
MLCPAILKKKCSRSRVPLPDLVKRVPISSPFADKCESDMHDDSSMRLRALQQQHQLPSGPCQLLLLASTVPPPMPFLQLCHHTAPSLTTHLPFPHLRLACKRPHQQRLPSPQYHAIVVTDATKASPPRELQPSISTKHTSHPLTPFPKLNNDTFSWKFTSICTS